MAIDKRGRKLPRGIRQRGDKYEGRFMVDGKSYSVTGRTIKEVQQKIVDEKYRLEHIKNGDDITVDEWFRHWNDTYGANRKQTTKDSWESYYRRHIASAFGDVPLNELKRENIMRFLTGLEGKYVSGTISHIRSVLNILCRDAVEDGLIPSNPVPPMRRIGGLEDGHREALTAEQEKLFLDYAKDQSKYYSIIYLQLRTGMRIGEVTGLKTTDIDWDGNWIHVRRTLQRTSAGHLEQTPKTKAGIRSIPMNTDVRSLLWSQCEPYRESGTDGYIFFQKNYKAIDAQMVNDAVKGLVRLIRATGHPDFPDVTTHVFRHTFATRAIEAGMSPQTLKVILGHSSISMTMDLYSHVMPDTKASEMALLAQ